jgi:hypothetical protein
MEQLIKIPRIVGQFTNGDLEDVSPEYATLLSNLRPNNGKLEKTFGFGTLLDGTVGFTPKWIGTYFHQSLNSTNGSGTGYVYLAYTVNASTNHVTIYEWNSGAWKAIDGVLLANTLGTFHHNNDTNPVIQENGIIRFLPGNLGSVGSDACEGIWIGYIDRDLFDGASSVIAGFYAFPTTLTKPDITATGINLTGTASDGGSFPADSTKAFYKTCAIYDGNQKSMLSDAYGISVSEGSIVTLGIDIVVADHAERITGIDIYRSTSSDGIYNKVQAIDFLRKTNNAPHASPSSTLYSATKYAYISNGGDLHGLDIGTFQLLINSPEGGWQSGTITDVLDTEGNILQIGAEAFGYQDTWDAEWQIKVIASGVVVASGYTGAYSGPNVAIFNNAEALDYAEYASGVLIFTSTGELKEILAHFGKAIKVARPMSILYEAVAYELINVQDGLYWTAGTTTIHYTAYDYYLTPGAEHPYPNAVSINMNGRFAQVNQGRLFLHNVVLDPGDSDEAHDDWIGYSEEEAYDALNVSNVFQPSDSKGGAGIGLKISFNSLIAMKPHSYFKIDLVDPSDDTTWITKESRLERGNIAPFGCLQNGHKFYPLSYDGIYEVDVNMLAASNDTPLIDARVSEEINDQYLAITDANKALIVSGQNQIYNELVYALGSSGSQYLYLAFNTVQKKWRSILSAVNLTCFGTDYNGNLMGYDSVTGKVCGISSLESCSLWFKSKWFRVSYDRADIIRYIKVTYSSVNSLYMNIYLDGSPTTPESLSTWQTTGTYTLDATSSGVISTIIIPVGRRCKSFMFDITDTAANVNSEYIYGYEIVMGAS